MSDSTDEVLRVIPLLENLKSQRGETDWLDEQVSTERGSAKCPGVAEDAPEREREKKKGPLEVWMSWKCGMQCKFSILNLIQSDMGCQEECKQQFGDVEGETSFSFL